jgi:hypothetical protein
VRKDPLKARNAQEGTDACEHMMDVTSLQSTADQHLLGEIYLQQWKSARETKATKRINVGLEGYELHCEVVEALLTPVA